MKGVAYANGCDIHSAGTWYVANLNGEAAGSIVHEIYDYSYQTTGAFLSYIVNNHDPKFVEKLNRVMRNGEYDESMWKDNLGRTPPELWAEYIKTLK